MSHPRVTRMLKVNPRQPEEDVIRLAAAVLKQGGLVAFPTETVYGLGAHALMPEAVAGIFQAKGRPSDNPLIVHVPGVQEARSLAAHWPDRAQRLAEAFWPGPLTLVVPAAAHIPPIVTAGLDTVAIRVPAHPVALALLKEAGVPVAAPSANRSGRPSPTRASHVWDDLQGLIDLILDGGPVGIGLESTVVDVSGSTPVLLRPGGITREALEGVLGPVELDPAVLKAAGHNPPRSPGMKYRHYAPACPALVVEGPTPARWRQLARLVQDHLARGETVGVIASQEAAAYLDRPGGGDRPGVGGRLILRATGPLARPESYAARLFADLRELDQLGADIILMEGIEPAGMGLAVMNRIRKAAGFHIIRAGEETELPS